MLHTKWLSWNHSSTTKNHPFSLSISSKNGEKDSLIWLSILGKVYDVTEGKEYYGPGESYNSLTAADTSVPFVSGTFTPEEAKKDPGTDFELYFWSFRWLRFFLILSLFFQFFFTVELSDMELTGIMEWKKFYEETDKYHLVGKLIDPRYYDEDGNEQPSLVSVLERLEKIKKEEEEKKAAKEANKRAHKQAQQEM